MKIQMMTLMLVTGLLAACGKHSDNPQAPANNPVPSTTVVYQVNGMAASDYYNQFFFKPTSSCDNPDVFFRFLASEDVKVAVNKDGQDVLASIAVLLYPDHSFKAAYVEKDVMGYTDRGYYYRKSRSRILQGAWQVVETRMELSGIGSAMGVQLGSPGQPGVFLTVDTDLMTPGLSGQTMTMRYVSADYVPVPGANPCE